MRFLFLFHPWAQLLHFSIHLPSATRGVLLMARVCGSMLAAALFFSASGSASSLESPEACQTKNVGEMLGMLFVVGMISSILSSVPLFLFLGLHTRGFANMGTADQDTWRRQLRAWRRNDAIVLGFCIAYIGFALFFVMTFIANVSRPDAATWLISMLISIVKETVVVPVVVSVTLAAWTTLMSRCPVIVQESDLHRQGGLDRSQDAKPIQASLAEMPEASMKVEFALGGLNYHGLEQETQLMAAFKEKASKVFLSVVGTIVEPHEISVHISRNSISISLAAEADRTRLAQERVATGASELARALAVGLTAIPGSDAAISPDADLLVRNMAISTRGSIGDS